MPVDEFCTAPGRNVLKPGELLTTLEFPPPRREERVSHYQRFIPRNEMDIAVVGAASWVQLDAAGKTIEAARIALGRRRPDAAVRRGSEQFARRQTRRPKPRSPQAGELAKKIATPISDMRGPAEYRTHLVGVLVEADADEGGRTSASQ